MSPERELLEQQRDQALRDIVDLERQVAEHEIPEVAADRLRRTYETAAAHAIDGLEAAIAAERENPEQAPGAPRRSTARLAAYIAAAGVAVFAVVVLLPQHVATRPAGGFVTGNEVVQANPDMRTPAPSAPASAPRDLSKVTEAEMEAVIAANPDVLGMRLALAKRYVDKGEYDKAAEHYGVALKQDPGNPDVHAQSGWLLFKLGKPDASLRFVNQALRIDPGSQDALWFKANILIEGRNDPAGALDVLRRLGGRDDLPAHLRDQVNQLIATAQQRQQAGGR
ncbi:MAG: tetratricopeptide repeat protein [Pseudonocardiaceae bacterium]